MGGGSGSGKTTEQKENEKPKKKNKGKRNRSEKDFCLSTSSRTQLPVGNFTFSSTKGRLAEQNPGSDCTRYVDSAAYDMTLRKAPPVVAAQERIHPSRTGSVTALQTPIVANCLTGFLFCN